MMIRARVVLTSLAIAVPATAILGYPVELMRTRDMRAALERAVRSQANDAVRERCDAEPNWFFTGPLEGRPRKGEAVDTSPDALPPRPKTTPQPFELFGYDEDFLASSSVAPRFPTDFRTALRMSSVPVTGTFQSATGTGVDFAMATGWIGSQCAYFLGRLQPTPGLASDRLWFTALTFMTCFGVALLALGETTWRVRKLATAARASAGSGFGTIAPDALRDELSSLTFVFNDAAKELALRRDRIEDQDTALRRFVESADEDVAVPLRALEADLGAIELGAAGGDARGALQRAHDLSARIENLTAAARLRLAGADAPSARFDLNALVARVAARHAAMAHAAGVAIRVDRPATSVMVSGEERLVERAVANLVDNAIRYNQAGGQVTIGLALVEGGGRFRLSVADNGRGVSDEEFRGLTAVRRFRGDEHRLRRPGAPGLGLAVAREGADRAGMQLDLKRPGAGGFESELGGKVSV